MAKYNENRMLINRTIDKYCCQLLLRFKDKAKVEELYSTGRKNTVALSIDISIANCVVEKHSANDMKCNSWLN